jgi:hypothetical protein
MSCRAFALLAMRGLLALALAIWAPAALHAPTRPHRAPLVFTGPAQWMPGLAPLAMDAGLLRMARNDAAQADALTIAQWLGGPDLPLRALLLR